MCERGEMCKKERGEGVQMKESVRERGMERKRRGEGAREMNVQERRVCERGESVKKGCV